MKKTNFNTGRPAPTNTFDWGNYSLTEIQQLYTKVFTLNEASAADTLRMCNAGMTDAAGTISTNSKVNSSGFSFGPVQFDLALDRKGNPRNTIGRDAFEDIVRNATDASANRIFNRNQADAILRAMNYRDNQNSPDAIKGRQTMLQYRSKIDQALQSSYGEEAVRKATLRQFSDLEMYTRRIINSFQDQAVRDYLSGSLLAQGLIADFVNQRGPTNAGSDVKKIVNDMKSQQGGLSDSGLTSAAKKSGRAHAAERVRNIKKAIAGKLFKPSVRRGYFDKYVFGPGGFYEKFHSLFKTAEATRSPIVFDLDQRPIRGQPLKMENIFP